MVRARKGNPQKNGVRRRQKRLLPKKNAATTGVEAGMYLPKAATGTMVEMFVEASTPT